MNITLYLDIQSFAANNIQHILSIWSQWKCIFIWKIARFFTCSYFGSCQTLLSILYADKFLFRSMDLAWLENYGLKC